MVSVRVIVLSIMAIGIFGLFLSAMLPAAVDGTNERIVNQTMTNDTSLSLTDELTVAVTDIDDTDGVTIEYTNENTQNTIEKQMNESDTEVQTLDGEDIETTVQEIDSDAQEVTFSSTFTPSFGWDGGAAIVLENIEVILVLLFFLTIVAGMAVMVG